MARLPNFLVIIRSEKLSGKGQGRGAKKRTFRFGKKNVSFPKVETFRFADYICPKGEIGTKKVLEGRFMVALYKGTYQQLGAVYDTLYGKYLPEMGLSLREVPSGEIYLNDPRNTKPEDLLTQIYVAVE